MAVTFSVCLLILLSCQQVSTRTITAGSGTGSLTDYLHSASQVFFSFTTLVFSPGVHDMCEDSVVVIRDVTNIALIGSETTTTKSVQVGGGEVVDVIEPSTVIDCHGCPTGFVFSNVSELSMKRITLAQCGGSFFVYYETTPWSAHYPSSLTFVTVQDLTLDTVSFRNNTGNYSLVAINLLGKSTIMNTLIAQNTSLSPVYQQGSILLFYADLRNQQSILTKQSVLFVDSVVFLYTAKGYFLPIDSDWPYFVMAICSCSFEIQISLMYITIHTVVHDY